MSYQATFIGQQHAHLKNLDIGRAPLGEISANARANWNPHTSEEFVELRNQFDMSLNLPQKYAHIPRFDPTHHQSFTPLHAYQGEHAILFKDLVAIATLVRNLLS